jgi:hypothetical protein
MPAKLLSLLTSDIIACPGLDDSQLEWQVEVKSLQNRPTSLPIQSKNGSVERFLFKIDGQLPFQANRSMFCLVWGALTSYKPAPPSGHKEFKSRLTGMWCRFNYIETPEKKNYSETLTSPWVLVDSQILQGHSGCEGHSKNSRSRSGTFRLTF